MAAPRDGRHASEAHPSGGRRLPSRRPALVSKLLHLLWIWNIITQNALDACVLIDLLQYPEHQEPAKSVVSLLKAAEEGQMDLVTSVLSIAEVCFAASERTRNLEDDVEEKIKKLWRPAASPIRLVEVHELIAREAHKLVRYEGVPKKWFGIKGPDAIHLMTAQRERVDALVTNDKGLDKCGKQLGLQVCQPLDLASQSDSPTSLFSEGNDSKAE